MAFYCSGLVGIWEILDCVPESATEGKKGIEGTTFELTDRGEVWWNVPAGTADVPLLHCDAYQLVSRGTSNALLKFGTYRGHVIEFQVVTYRADPGLFVTSKEWCLLQCMKIGDSIREAVLPSFTFLPALEDGYFSDLEIVASNGKKFRVHTSILKLIVKDLDWSAQPPPLSGLPEEVLGTTLHYLYAQCLPADLSARTAGKVLALLTDLPQLQALLSLCTSYLNHLSLKDRIIEILGEIHACFVRTDEHFSRRNAHYDPASLILALKRSARDAAVAYAKWMLLAHMYNQHKAELTPTAIHELIRCTTTKMPLVFGQVKSFLVGLSLALNGLQAAERQELASYLLPELETMLDTAASLFLKIQGALDLILRQGMNIEGGGGVIKTVSPDLKQRLNNVLQEKELNQLRCALQNVMLLHRYMLQRKENLRIMSSGSRVRSLARNLEQLIEGLPVFLLRLEELTGALNLIEWNESHFSFNELTAKVCEVLRKLTKEKDSMKDLMIQLCELVERESFTNCVVELGLLDSSAVPNILSAEYKTDPLTNTQSSLMLNMTGSFSMAPSAEKNTLSEATGVLLELGLDTDMVFEVIGADDVATRYPAHRVIVAARCDWIRRALLSGMQEDIQRRIEIHDSCPILFSRFLSYLYTGRLNSKSLSSDQLTELLLMSDRYEVDDLKAACEAALKAHLEEDSVLDFLTLADQFNALALKESCVQFISDHPNVLDHDVMTELPASLQAEVYDWVQPHT